MGYVYVEEEFVIVKTSKYLSKLYLMGIRKLEEAEQQPLGI
jgi:hypothetical protein